MFIVFALAIMLLVSVRSGNSTAATNYKSTVIAEVICNASTPIPGTTPSPLASPSPIAIEFDQIYLDLMIEQQNRLMRMALVAADRSDSPEVQLLSRQIVDGVTPVFERLRDTRRAWFDGGPALEDAALMNELDKLGQLQPAVGGVPGAMEIIQGESAVTELCSVYDEFDVTYLSELIEQLDSGLLLSQTALQIAGRDETKVIASLIIKSDQPFKDTAIAYRDLLLRGSPIPEDH